MLNNRSRKRLAVAAVVAGSGAVMTATGVYAALQATAFNTTPQAVSSGTLKLVLGDNGAGFTTAISNLAPGDTVNRFVTLSNTGTLEAKDLTLTVASSAANKLSNDATNGLQITFTECLGGTWSTAGACSTGTTGTPVSSSLSALAGTPIALTSGAIAPSAVRSYKVTTVLPDQIETTTNGTLPANTIQGLSTTLTFNFSEVQRVPATTTS